MQIIDLHDDLTWGLGCNLYSSLEVAYYKSSHTFYFVLGLILILHLDIKKHNFYQKNVK